MNRIAAKIAFVEWVTEHFEQGIGTRDYAVYISEDRREMTIKVTP